MYYGAPVCIDTVVFHVLLVDEGQGLAEVHVEYVQGFIPLNIRVKHGPICPPLQKLSLKN